MRAPHGRKRVMVHEETIVEGDLHTVCPTRAYPVSLCVALLDSTSIYKTRFDKRPRLKCGPERE